MTETWQRTDFDAIDERNRLTLFEAIADNRCVTVPDPDNPGCVMFRVTYPEGHEFAGEHTDFGDEIRDLGDSVHWGDGKVWVTDAGRAALTDELQELEILRAIGTGRVYNVPARRGPHLFTYDPADGDRFHFPDGFTIGDLIDNEWVDDLDANLTPTLTMAGYKYVSNLSEPGWDDRP